MMNIVTFICYTAISLAVGYVVASEFQSAGTINAVLAGGISFGLGALVHENISRRTTQAKLTRHLLSLKKAYDHTKLELDKARIDNQRFTQSSSSTTANNTSPAATRPDFTRPSFLDPVPELTRESNLFDAVKRQAAEEDDFRNLFASAPIPPESNIPGNPRPERAPPRRTPPPAPILEPVLTEKEISQVSSEVQVLHSLVEQLYSDIETPSSRTFEASPEPVETKTPSKPALKGANTAPPGKLRIVNDVDEKMILNFVRDGLRKDQVDLYLQPTVSLPQRKRRFFECYNHIRTDDGTVITQEQYKQVAIDAGILSAIDNMLLFRCMQLLRKVNGQDYSMAFFCNIVKHSLLDKEFFLKFAQYLKAHEMLAPNIVLELTQEDYLVSRGALITPMKILGKMGYRFSLDNVTDFNMNVSELLDRNFGYLKVDANLIVQQTNKGEGHIFRAFKQRMDEVGIDVIVAQIDSEQMLLELLDFNIDYGQGFLFGEPRTGKDAVASLKVS